MKKALVAREGNHCRMSLQSRFSIAPRVKLQIRCAQTNGGVPPSFRNSQTNGGIPTSFRNPQPNGGVPPFFSSAPPKNPQHLTSPTDGAFKASGKTVVITGGSQGVGRACALLFAKKGYNVVVAARDPSKLRYVADDCAELAGRQGASLAVTADVSRERDVKDLVNAVLAKYESVDVIINCAGVFARGPFQSTPLAEAKRLMDTNYFGTYLVSQNFLPILLKNAQRNTVLAFQKPTLVMVAGFAGKVPLKHMTAFSASKYAVVGLAEALRTEVEHQGVHLALVHPGVVKSNFMERSEFYGDEQEGDRRSWRQMVRALPLSQSPQEVAEAIYGAVQYQQRQVVVGAPFAAAVEAYKLLGVNASEYVS